MGTGARRKLLSGLRLISRNHSSPFLSNSFLSNSPFPLLVILSFPLDSSLLFFPPSYAHASSFVSHFNSSSSASCPLFIIHLLFSPAWHAPLLLCFSLLFLSFPLTFPPHHCPPLLYLPFITSAPLFLDFSFSVCQSSSFLLLSFCFSSQTSVHLLSSTFNSTTTPVNPQFFPGLLHILPISPALLLSSRLKISP